jgi:hypothetical protein
MKKLILATLLIGIISGCEESNVKKIEKQKTSYKLDGGRSIEILIIESCEYIYGPWGNATVLTHKGNCKNPIHKL